MLSLEFVASPEKARIAPAALPLSIRAAFAGITEFGGSQVMVSEQEPRLITVLVLWTGSEARQRCAQSVRNVRALLAPYLDRCLRVQTLSVHQPLPNALQPEGKVAGAGFMMEDGPAQDLLRIRAEGVCAA